MAGNQTILVGDKVPIVLQLADGAAGQFPRALVFDSTHHQLDQIDLTYLGEGLYFIAAGSYLMPDDFFIKVVYIVYTDAAHTIESTIYERDLDVFHRTHPDEFMATGFAVPGEYDGMIHDIQVDVGGLNGDPMRGTDLVPTNPLLTNDARLNNLDALISSRSSHGDPTDAIKGTTPGRTVEEAYNNERGTDGAYTGTPPTVGEIDVQLTANHGVGSWQEGSGGGATPAEIDAELTANHGVGSWQTGQGLDETDLHDGLDNYANKDGYKATGFAPPNEYNGVLATIASDVDGLDGEVMRGTDGANTTTPPTPAEIDTELTSEHGVGSWEGEGMSEGELHLGLDSYANKGGYKAAVSGLALEATSQLIKERTDRIPDVPSPADEYDTILTDIMTEVAGLDGASIPSSADVTAAIFDKIVEGTLTFNDFQRIMFAMLSGTSTGHELPASPKIYNSDDGLTARVAFTCDADGNRLSRVLTPGP